LMRTPSLNVLMCKKSNNIRYQSSKPNGTGQ
jgi:hypothetical protein